MSGPGWVVRGGRRATFPRSPAVSSPRRGLTSLFGMGRGAPPRHSRRLCLSLAAFSDGKRSDDVSRRFRVVSLDLIALHADPSLFLTFQEAGRTSSGAAASFRAISAARLNVSRRSHLRPIHVVVCDGPQRRPHLGAGFALRCLQRLSPPDAATRPCAWRRNRLTVGPSVPVLSY